MATAYFLLTIVVMSHVLLSGAQNEESTIAATTTTATYGTKNYTSPDSYNTSDFNLNNTVANTSTLTYNSSDYDELNNTSLFDEQTSTATTTTISSTTTTSSSSMDNVNRSSQFENDGAFNGDSISHTEKPGPSISHTTQIAQTGQKEAHDIHDAHSAHDSHNHSQNDKHGHSVSLSLNLQHFSYSTLSVLPLISIMLNNKYSAYL